MSINWIEYVPFGLAILAALGYNENRLSKKVDEKECKVHVDAFIQAINELKVDMKAVNGSIQVLAKDVSYMRGRMSRITKIHEKPKGDKQNV